MTESLPENESDVPQEIALLNKAYAALSEACTVDEVRDVRDRAEAVRSYARKARLGRQILIEAAALRLRSERRLGQMLQTIPLAKAAPGNQYSTAEPADEHIDAVRLQDLGITKSDSSRLQRIAAVPEERFQIYLKETIEANRECSTAACLRLVKSSGPTRKKPPAKPTSHSPQLQALINSPQRFSTVYAAPFEATGRAFGISELDEQTLINQPIGELCEANAHLYLMCPASRLPEALEIVEAWTFQYAFCIPWPSLVASSMIDLKNDQDLLLAGSRGKLEFHDLSTEFWSEIMDSSNMADALAELIQHLSPGPYLDLTTSGDPLNASWTTVAGGLPS